jgi:hypothetical protein
MQTGTDASILASYDVRRIVPSPSAGRTSR